MRVRWLSCNGRTCTIPSACTWRHVILGGLLAVQIAFPAAELAARIDGHGLMGSDSCTHGLMPRTRGCGCNATSALHVRRERRCRPQALHVRGARAAVGMASVSGRRVRAASGVHAAPHLIVHAGLLGLAFLATAFCRTALASSRSDGCFFWHARRKHAGRLLRRRLCLPCLAPPLSRQRPRDQQQQQQDKRNARRPSDGVL